MPDLKSIVRDLADSLAAIFEATPKGGFTIEVPLAGERYQSVSLHPKGKDIEIVTSVTELGPADRSTIERLEKRARRARIAFEDTNGAHSARVTALVPAADATWSSLEPVVLEVAKLGDSIESELTGGDVD